MKKLILLLPLFALAACGQEPASEPAAAQTAAPIEPALPAPDNEIFTAAFLAACPEAKPVNKSICKRAGLTSTDAICEYGLGDDEYLRHKATITPVDGAWTIADPETTCVSNGAE